MVEFIPEPVIHPQTIHPDERTLIAMLLSCRRDESLDVLKNVDDEAIKRVLKHSIGKGHWAALDLLDALFEFHVPRLETIRQARYEYGFKMLQQSTRAVELDSVFIPKNLENNEIYKNTVKDSFNLYRQLINSGVSKQNAMYTLPLGLMARNSLGGSIRAWLHYIFEGSMNNMPTISKVSSAKIKEHLKTSYPNISEYFDNVQSIDFYPTGSDFLMKYNKLFENEKKDIKIFGNNGEPDDSTIKKAVNGDIGSLNSLKMYVVEFMAKIDISVLHEFVRHRTIRKEIEPFNQAALRGKYHTPREIKTNDYSKLIEKMISSYKELINEGVPYSDALLILPHALETYVRFNMDYVNLLQFSGLRLCAKAKPSMRAFARKIKDELKKDRFKIGDYLYPRGEYLGHCPETNSGRPAKIKGNYCGLCPSLRIKNTDDHLLK